MHDVLNERPANERNIVAVLWFFNKGVLLFGIPGVGVVGVSPFELPPLVVGVGGLPLDFGKLGHLSQGFHNKINYKE